MSYLRSNHSQNAVHASNVRGLDGREGGGHQKKSCKDVRALNDSLSCFHSDLTSSFNKTQEDFPVLETYNNYLEEVEDLSKRRYYIILLIIVILMCPTSSYSIQSH